MPVGFDLDDPRFNHPLVCRKNTTHPDERFPLIWSIVESTFWCLNYLAKPTLANYNVTGTLTPDAACNYFYVGLYVGIPFYRRYDDLFFIWRDQTSGYWFINNEIGWVESPHWHRHDPSILGEYEPFGTEGVALVSEGPH